MTKSILIALAVAALPVLAQEAPAQCPAQPGAPKCHRPCHGKPGMHKHLLEKFDANKDGQLDEQEKEAMKAAREARHAEMKQKMLEKFDANKDGQLDEQEKEAMKAEFKAKHGKPCGDKPGCGKKGPRHHKGHGPKGPRACKVRMPKHLMEKFDANKDGQLDDQEKAAMKAEFEAKHAEMKAKFMEKFDVNKDGQLDDQEKAAIKADFEARHAEMKAKFMEKFDVNKDGQLDEQEKAAAKADFEARHGKPGCGKKGPRGHKAPKCGKCCH